MASPKILRERSIHICFTTRLGGVSPPPYDTLNVGGLVGDDPARVAENRQRVMTALALDATRLTTVRQVHGKEILEVDESNAGNLEAIAADALFTSLPNTPLAIFTADCVPVILADVNDRKIIVVHAGWKGIYSLIVPTALAALKDTAQGKIEGVYAFIGPAIGPCCYEVDHARAELFDPKFVESEAGRTKLNLPGIVRDQLVRAGVDSKRITDSGLCTCCRKDLFFSFRRDGICGRQMAAAALL